MQGQRSNGVGVAIKQVSLVSNFYYYFHALLRSPLHAIQSMS